MKLPGKRVLWYWLPPLLWPIGFRLAVLVLMSGQAPRWVAGHDKLLHFLYFAIMAILVWRGFRFERRFSPWGAAFAAFGVIALYGGLDELSQLLRPYRSAELHDWFADLAGAAMPFLVAAAETVIQRRRPAPVPLPCPEA